MGSVESSTASPGSRTTFSALFGSIGSVVGVVLLAVGLGVLLTGAMVLFDRGMVTVELLRRTFSTYRLAFVTAYKTVFLGTATVLLLVVSVRYGLISKRAFGVAVPSGHQILLGVGGAALVAAFAVGVHVLAIGVGVLEPTTTETTTSFTLSSYVGYAALTLLALAPIEELLFRGFVQNYVRPAVGSTVATVWTASLFTIYHMPAYMLQGFDSAILQFPIVVMLALVLCAAYERERNIVVPIIIHGGFNALFSLAGFVIL